MEHILFVKGRYQRAFSARETSQTSQKFVFLCKNGGKIGYVPVHLNPIALRKAKTLWSFGHSECDRVK